VAILLLALPHVAQLYLHQLVQEGFHHEQDSDGIAGVIQLFFVRFG
jgi:hypothetical protein